jgi:hypothetical protein
MMAIYLHMQANASCARTSSSSRAETNAGTEYVIDGGTIPTV